MPNRNQDSLCPLNDEAGNRSDRYNPKNKETALCYQLHDSLRSAFGMAHASPESFIKALDIVESHIQIYRQTADAHSKHQQAEKQ